MILHYEKGEKPYVRSTIDWENSWFPALVHTSQSRKKILLSLMNLRDIHVRVEIFIKNSKAFVDNSQLIIHKVTF